MRYLPALPVILLALGLLATACGGNGDSTPTPTSGGPGVTPTATSPAPPTATTVSTPTPTATTTTVGVDLGEWFVNANTAAQPAGSITFVVDNTGTIAHTFVVIRTDLAPDSLVVEGSQVDESASGTVIGRIETSELGSGQSASSTFQASSGSYALICNLPGHYGFGMRTAFEVN